MNKKLLKITNSLLALSFLLVSITGVLQYLFPLRFYFGLHKQFGIVMVVLAIIHIFLNRGWIKAAYTKKK